MFIIKFDEIRCEVYDYTMCFQNIINTFLKKISRISFQIEETENYTLTKNIR